MMLVCRNVGDDESSDHSVKVVSARFLFTVVTQ